MNVTSAIPIISAAAVAAVRPGLRCAFRSASLPALPPMRRAGMPTARTSGRTSRDDSIATPTNSARTPTPSSAKRSPVAMSSDERAVAEREHGERDDEARDVRREAREPAARQRRALADGGDRRHARRSDRREEAGDERHERPDEQRDDDRAGGEDGLGLGQVEVQRLEELVQPDGEREAAEEADHRGAEADHERLEDHGPEHLPPRRAERAQAWRTPASAARP